MKTKQNRTYYFRGQGTESVMHSPDCDNLETEPVSHRVRFERLETEYTSRYPHSSIGDIRDIPQMHLRRDAFQSGMMSDTSEEEESDDYKIWRIILLFLMTFFTVFPIVLGKCQNFSGLLFGCIFTACLLYCLFGDKNTGSRG